MRVVKSCQAINSSDISRRCKYQGNESMAGPSCIDVVSSQTCVVYLLACRTRSTHERWKIARAVHSMCTCILDDMPSRERRLACSAAEIDSACATTRPRASLFACHELSTQAPPCSNTNMHVIGISPSCYKNVYTQGIMDTPIPIPARDSSYCKGRI